MKKPKVKSILFIYVLGGIILLLFAVDTFLTGSDLQKQSGYYTNILYIISLARLIISLTLVAFCSYYAYQSQKSFSIMYNLEDLVNTEMDITKESARLDALQQGMVLKKDIFNHADKVMRP